MQATMQDVQEVAAILKPLFTTAEENSKLAIQQARINQSEMAALMDTVMAMEGQIRDLNNRLRYAEMEIARLSSRDDDMPAVREPIPWK